MGNPWSGITVPRSAQPRMSKGRSLSPAQWQFVVDDLQWVEYPPGSEDEEHVEGWLLNVVGKGQKLCQAPVPVDVVGQLADDLITRGLDADP